jgi:hypothetical protein
MEDAHRSSGRFRREGKLPSGGASPSANPAYSFGSAAVWAVILAVGRRRLDSQTWKTLRLVCAGWWSGWTSAAIARAGYPAPKTLTPQAERRLETVSLALIAIGFISVMRPLIAGSDRRP